MPSMGPLLPESPPASSNRQWWIRNPLWTSPTAFVSKLTQPVPKPAPAAALKMKPEISVYFPLVTISSSALPPVEKLPVRVVLFAQPPALRVRTEWTKVEAIATVVVRV